MSVLKGPLNRVSDGPRHAGICLDEMEAVVGGGEKALGEDQRPGDCSGGLKEFSAIGHDCSLGMAHWEDAVGDGGVRPFFPPNSPVGSLESITNFGKVCRVESVLNRGSHSRGALKWKSYRITCE